MDTKSIKKQEVVIVKTKKNTTKKGGEKNMSKTRKPGEKPTVGRVKRSREQAVIDACLAAINAKMERDGISKSQLADKLGVTAPNVHQVLNRGRAMTLRTLARISDALGCTVSVTLKAA